MLVQLNFKDFDDKKPLNAVSTFSLKQNVFHVRKCLDAWKNKRSLVRDKEIIANIA